MILFLPLNSTCERWKQQVWSWILTVIHSEITLRNGRAVTFGVGISLSVQQLDLSPTKAASCLRMGNSRFDFRGWLGVFWVCFLSCWQPAVGILLILSDGDIMPLLYCFNPGIADTHSSLQCRGRLKQIRGNTTFRVSWHTAQLNMSFSLPLSDGGVWQSSLQKAPFPSGSVDQLAQEALCQTRRPLAKRYLCQVSL